MAGSNVRYRAGVEMTDTRALKDEMTLPKILDKEGYVALSPELRSRYCCSIRGIIERARKAPTGMHDSELTTYVKNVLTANTFEYFWREEHFNRALVGQSIPSLVAYTIRNLQCPELYARNVLGSYDACFVKGGDLISMAGIFPKILSKEEFEALTKEDRVVYTKAVRASVDFENTKHGERFHLLDESAKDFLSKVLKAKTLEDRWCYRYLEGEKPGTKVPSLLAYTADWFDIVDIAKELFPREYEEQCVVLAPEPKPLPPKAEEVIGFQIYPFYRDAGQVVMQSCGADENTEGYNVYKRLSDTSLVWHDEWRTEAEAVTCAETLSRYTGLPILRYEWQEPQAPTLAESSIAFENFAKDHPALKMVRFSTSAKAYVYPPTQIAKEVWDAACSWMQQVFAAKR